MFYVIVLLIFGWISKKSFPFIESIVFQTYLMSQLHFANIERSLYRVRTVLLFILKTFHYLWFFFFLSLSFSVDIEYIITVCVTNRRTSHIILDDNQSDSIISRQYFTFHYLAIKCYKKIILKIKIKWSEIVSLFLLCQPVKQQKDAASNRQKVWENKLKQNKTKIKRQHTTN